MKSVLCNTNKGILILSLLLLLLSSGCKWPWEQDEEVALDKREIFMTQSKLYLGSERDDKTKTSYTGWTASWGAETEQIALNWRNRDNNLIQDETIAYSYGSKDSHSMWDSKMEYAYCWSDYSIIDDNWNVVGLHYIIQVSVWQDYIDNGTNGFVYSDKAWRPQRLSSDIEQQLFAGIDCSGLVQRCAHNAQLINKSIGDTLSGTTWQSNCWNANTLTDKFGDTITLLKDLKVGDLAHWDKHIAIVYEITLYGTEAADRTIWEHKDDIDILHGHGGTTHADRIVSVTSGLDYKGATEPTMKRLLND